MKLNAILLIIITFLLIQCKSKPRECDDFGPFEEWWIYGRYRIQSKWMPSKDSVKISETKEVTIYTNTDSTNYIREGILEYEITEGPDCICVGGYDRELGCQIPCPIYKGRGTITITYSNDSICDVDVLDIEFTSYSYETVIDITGGDCLDIHVEKNSLLGFQM